MENTAATELNNHAIQIATWLLEDALRDIESFPGGSSQDFNEARAADARTLLAALQA
jgi:hypothetical protein